MASKGNETRQVARRELKRMLAEYLHGKVGLYDTDGKALAANGKE